MSGTLLSSSPRQRPVRHGAIPLVAAVVAVFCVLEDRLPATADTTLVFMPGTTTERVAARGIGATITLTDPDEVPYNFATVSFDRSDAEKQNIRLFARSRYCPLTDFPFLCGPPGSREAVASGKLVVDFCIPRQGMSTCDATPVADPGMTTITLTFGVAYNGRIIAAPANPSATVQITSSVLDEHDRAVAFNQVLNETVGGLFPQTVDFLGLLPVSIPIPEIDNPTERTPTSFTLLINRGRRYRFQLFASARGKSGLGSTDICFADCFVRSARPQGYVQLDNLTVQVAADQPDFGALIESLQALITSLQAQLGRLAEQAGQTAETILGRLDGAIGQKDSLEGGVSDLAARLTLLEQKHDALAADTDALRRLVTGVRPPTPCVPPDPFAGLGGGTCSNGGWLPPGAAPAPPPPPPVGGCTTPDPFVSIGGGVCVRGGWIPRGGG